MQMALGLSLRLTWAYGCGRSNRRPSTPHGNAAVTFRRYIERFVKAFPRIPVEVVS